MEIGTEISQKIRSAIKAKLVDLGAYVDDELPDYIMVMIANKKTQEQMADDLSLFLGNNTDKFTTWLHTVLQKLQSATLESASTVQVVTATGKQAGERTDPKHAGSKEIYVQTTPQPPQPPPPQQQHQQQKAVSEVKDSTPYELSEPEEAVISLKPESNDFIDEELKSDTAGKESFIPVVVNIRKQTVQKATVPPTTAEGQSSIISRAPTSRRPITVSKVQPVTRKRKTPGSVIGQVITRDNDDDDDDDDYKVSRMGGVASVVRISERRTSLPRSKQASRALVLRAVSEAADSVSRVPGRQRPTVKSPTSKASQGNKALILKAMTDAQESLSRQPRTGKLVQVVRRVEPLTTSTSTPTVTVVNNPVSQHSQQQQQLLAAEDDTTVEDITETEVEFSDLEAEEDVKYYVLEPEEPSPVVRRMVAREIQATPVVRGRVSDELITKAHRTTALEQDTAPVVICRRFSDDITTTSVGGRMLTKVDAIPGCTQIVTDEMHTAPRRARTLSDEMGTVPRRSQMVSDEMDTVPRRMLVVSNAMDTAPRRMRMETDEINMAPSTMRMAADEMDEAPRRIRVVADNTLPGRSRMVSDEMDLHVAPRRTQIVSREMEMETAPRRMLVVADEMDTTPRRTQIVTEEMQHVSSVIPNVEIQRGMSFQVGDQRIFQSSSTVDEDITTEEIPIFNEPKVLRQHSTPNQRSFHRTIIDRPRAVSPKFIVTLDGVDPPTRRQAPMAGKKRVHPAARAANRQQINVTLDDEGVGDELEEDDEEEEEEEEEEEVVDEEEVEEMEKEEDDDAYMEACVVRQRTQLQPIVIHKTIQSDEEDMVTDTSPPKKTKLTERCKFWPTCKNGDNCPYHHPNVPCKAFPKCRYGDKCFYIHPNCKYDARCGKVDCPFTHASKRQGSGLPPPAPPPSPVTRPIGAHFAALSTPVISPHQVVCRFYPNNCKKMDCPYLHPKPCRYGTSCARSDCRYSHPKIPSGAALKWVRPDMLSKSS